MNPKTWHFRQLEHELKNRPPHETNRIDLINPETVKELDQILFNDFWLAVKGMVDDSKFSIMEGCLTDDGKPSMNDKWDRLPCRSFEIRLDNRENPLHPQNFLRNWIADIKMECGSDYYYMQVEYHLFLPVDYDFSNTLFLMSYPDFQALPPDLSYSSGSPFSEDLFSLKFTFGAGGNRFHRLIKGTPETVRGRIASLLELLRTSEAFAEDVYDDEYFPDLLEDLIQVCECWG